MSFPWQYKHGLICMCYLALGGLYWRYEMIFRKFLKNWIIFLLVIGYVLCSIIFRSYLASGYMTSMEQIHPVGVLWSFLACLLLVELCRKLHKNGFMTFIGQNSIGFYFMSGALPTTFGLIANKYLVSGTSSMLIAIWMVCIVVAYIVVLIINRWIPWLWDLRQINRQ